MTRKSRNRGISSGRHMTERMILNDPTFNTADWRSMQIRWRWIDAEREKRASWQSCKPVTVTRASLGMLPSGEGILLSR